MTYNASDAEALDYGFALPAGTDLIRGGDETIKQNAKAAAGGIRATLNRLEVNEKTLDDLTATATTLDYGQPATVTVTGTRPAKVINIGIPKGMSDDVGAQLLDQNAQTLSSVQAAEQQSTAAAADAAEAVTLAQQAQAAAYNVPDVAMRDIINNPATEARGALDATFVGTGEIVLNALDHGLRGDNTTEDLTALSAKLADVEANGGRAAVYFPPGDYVMTQPLPNIDYVHYYGDRGIPSNKRTTPYSPRTRLKWITGSMLVPDRTLYGISFESLAIQAGNVRTDPAGYLIDFDVNGTGASPVGMAFADFTRCWIDIVAEMGGFIRGGIAAQNNINDFFDIWIDRCRIERTVNVTVPTVHLRARNGGLNHVTFRGGWHHSRGNTSSPFLIIEGDNGAQPIGDIVFDSVIGEQNNGGWIHIGSPNGVTIRHCKEWDAAAEYTDDVFKIYKTAGGTYGGGSDPAGLVFENSGTPHVETYAPGKYLLRVSSGNSHRIGYVPGGSATNVSLPQVGRTLLNGGATSRSLRASNVSTTATTADDVLLCGAAGITVTLPAVAETPVGRAYTVMNRSAGNVTVAQAGGTVVVIPTFSSETVINSGFNWLPLG